MTVDDMAHTFTSIDFVYRLLKFGDARWVIICTIQRMIGVLKGRANIATMEFHRT